MTEQTRVASHGGWRAERLPDGGLLLKELPHGPYQVIYLGDVRPSQTIPNRTLAVLLSALDLHKETTS